MNLNAHGAAEIVGTGTLVYESGKNSAARIRELEDQIVALEFRLSQEKVFSTRMEESRARYISAFKHLTAALTPSPETKAAYIGEFQFLFPVKDDEGKEVRYTPNVPWVTIKQIMDRIHEAGLAAHHAANQPAGQPGG